MPFPVELPRPGVYRYRLLINEPAHLLKFDGMGKLVDDGTGRTLSISYLTFVAVDETDKPVPVPPLRLETEAEKTRALEAETRRVARLKLRPT